MIKKWKKKLLDPPHDLDPHQILMGSLLGNAPPLHKISWKSVQSFL